MPRTQRIKRIDSPRDLPSGPLRAHGPIAEKDVDHLFSGNGQNHAIILYKPPSFEKLIVYVPEDVTMITNENDLLVTTPKSKSDIAAAEAEACLKAGGGYYFRTFRGLPDGLGPGTRIFYVDRGYVRGFGVVEAVQEGSKVCELTGEDYGEGYHALMPANTWKWIEPIKWRGFPGFRYFGGEEVTVIGSWTDPMPQLRESGDET